MKIVFICGSLEPGRDGVGDYSRRLAGEMISQGHHCLLISLNDSYIQDFLVGMQRSQGRAVPVLRLSSSKSLKDKFSKAKRTINQFDPDWLSLQFVPFAFQKKGLPWRLGKELATLVSGKKWHIMFHELWVGMDEESPLKHKLWGRAQQYLIKQIISNLNPQVISTQSKLYKVQLEQLGYRTALIPLFGNVPVLPFDLPLKEDTALSFLIFGMIQPGAPIKEFLKELEEYVRGNEKKVRFTFIGRSGSELSSWKAACENSGFEVIVLGEQSPRIISETLRSARWGISSTPFLQSEKSGTIAAMREHNLPVYCVSRPWNPKISLASLPEGIREYRQNQLDLIPPVTPAYAENDLRKVGQQMAEYFNNQ